MCSFTSGTRRDSTGPQARLLGGSWQDQEWHAIPDNCPGLDSQERLLLQDALAVLGEEERRIVLLHTAGLKHREIGQALGLPLATVLSKYHRALKKMRAYMEGDDAR